MDHDVEPGDEGLWRKLRLASRWRELREIEQVRQFVAGGPYARGRS